MRGHTRMVSFRRRLGERSADVLDWVDYRPDADFRFLFLLPPMLSATWAYGGFVGLGLLLTFVLSAVLVVAILFGFGLLAWVVANAVLDIVPPLRLPSLHVPRMQRATVRGTRGA